MERVVEAVAVQIERLQKEKQRVAAAIDGRCAAGKTTLAQMLQTRLDCDIVHMDAFFLRPEQRTAERYRIPGGNVDYERLQTDVLVPLQRGHPFSYRPFLCSTGQLGEPIAVRGETVVIFEGSYSCHPMLWEQYDLHIFLTVDAAEQRKRLERRDANKLQAFLEKWIPLEEAYFSCYDVERKCELSFETKTMVQQKQTGSMVGVR